MCKPINCVSIKISLTTRFSGKLSINKWQVLCYLGITHIGGGPQTQFFFERNFGSKEESEVAGFFLFSQ